jgi:hypothetical protein
VLAEGEFLFCTAGETLAAQARDKALGWFHEAEGVTLILEREAAEALGFAAGLPMRRITLEVFSALDGVGLTAAVATALSAQNIPCNVVAAYHHDHIFVPAPQAEEALAALRALQAHAALTAR